MNTDHNSACVLRTVNYRADASQRLFTVINHVIYKQANKNKWLKYNSEAAAPNVSLTDCRRSCFCADEQCSEIQDDANPPHRWEQVCVCVVLNLCACGLLVCSSINGGRRDRWGEMRPGGGSLVLCLMKGSCGCARGGEQHTQSRAAE